MADMAIVDSIRGLSHFAPTKLSVVFILMSLLHGCKMVVSPTTSHFCVPGKNKKEAESRRHV